MIKKIYKSFIKKHKLLAYTLYSLIFILIIVTIVYNIYKKIKQKTIYVGCLYSETGVIGKASYDNYKILLDSFKYLVKMHECPINIIPIYKDLEDELNNITTWVEECVKKYNIKYFFGCWRSSERKHILPILQKHNARLFYPLQYEGIEASKYVYYFGGCPNQQLIPGLKYIFDQYAYYSDVYVVGSDYSYPRVSLELVEKFIQTSKKEYNKKLVYSEFFPLDQKDFSTFITKLFNKSPNGAIIINLINGKSYYDFSKQLCEMYSNNFDNGSNILKLNQFEIVSYFEKNNIKNILKCSERYPSISTSVVENDIPNEMHKYIQGNYYVWNFTNNIITDKTYYINIGYENSDNDYQFLKKFYNKQNRPIGDTQYCSFLSALFF